MKKAIQIIPIRNLIFNNCKNINYNNKDNKNYQKIIDGIDFTFNESLNTNPNFSNINLGLKDNIIENENINKKKD